MLNQLGRALNRLGRAPVRVAIRARGLLLNRDAPFAESLSPRSESPRPRSGPSGHTGTTLLAECFGPRSAFLSEWLYRHDAFR